MKQSKFFNPFSVVPGAVLGNEVAEKYHTDGLENLGSIALGGLSSFLAAKAYGKALAKNNNEKPMYDFFTQSSFLPGMVVGGLYGGLTGTADDTWSDAAIGSAISGIGMPAFIKYKTSKQKPFYESIEEAFLSILSNKYNNFNFIIKDFKNDKQAQNYLKNEAKKMGLNDEEIKEEISYRMNSKVIYKNNKLIGIIAVNVQPKEIWNSISKSKINCNVLDFQGLHDEILIKDFKKFKKFIEELAQLDSKTIAKILQFKTIKGCLAIYLNNDFVSIKKLKDLFKNRVKTFYNDTEGYLIIS